MGLFTPFYMQKGLDGPKRAKALKKVKGMTSQKQLVKIATRAPEEEFRKVAAGQLDDTGVLEQIAFNDGNKFVRTSAVRRLGALGAEEVLARIALRGDGPQDFSDTAGEAANAMRDKVRLAEIARSAPLADARGYAVAKLDDPEALRAAASDENEYVRAAALRRIDDPSVLARAALSGKGLAERMAAVGNPHLTDPSVLAEVAIRGGDPTLMCQAVEDGRLTDPEALKRVALETPNLIVRNKAIERIDDVETLARVAGGEGPASDGWHVMPHSSDWPAWNAALRLSRIAPERAVEPLVRLMLKDRDNSVSRGMRTEAIRFLIDRYATSNSPEVRDIIHALPDCWYGHTDNEGCTHSDSRVHFDLPR